MLIREVGEYLGYGKGKYTQPQLRIIEDVIGAALRGFKDPPPPISLSAGSRDRLRKMVAASMPPKK